MDPASVAIGVVSGAGALALMAIQTTTYLMGIKDTFQQASLIYLDLVTSCQAFETAWSQIHEWACINPFRSNKSTQVFEKLRSYLEASKVMLDSLQADLERFSPKNKSSLRSMSFSRRKAIYIHEKLLQGHCERLHRQTSSLHLLLSTAKLPSIEMQNIVVDVFQPVFRKDEETAWTIVQSKQSTRPPPSTNYSESVRSALQKHGTVEHSGPKFTFENDLFLSPVYKRLLLRSLSAPDPIEECSPQEQSPVLTGELRNHGVGNGPEIQVDDASSLQTSSSPDNLAMTPNNIINALRSVGDFSVGVQFDLRELRQTLGSFNLPKRSLPLHSALKRAQMEPEEQLHLNEQLLRAAVQHDEGLVAEALDNGADINSTGIDGNSALDISLKHGDLASHLRQGYSIVVELLLLYRETTLTSKSRGKGTILHLAILSGNVATVACLAKDCASELQSMIHQGAPHLYIASTFSHQDLSPFRAINLILASNSINPDRVSRYEGKSALHLAAIEGDCHSGAALVGVGCDPFARMQDPTYDGNIKELHGSALFFATKLGHTLFVSSVSDQFLKQGTNPSSANPASDDTLDEPLASPRNEEESSEELLPDLEDIPAIDLMDTSLEENPEIEMETMGHEEMAGVTLPSETLQGSSTTELVHIAEHDGNSASDDTLELVDIAEHDGIGETAEMLLSRSIDWPRNSHMRSDLLSSLVGSQPSRDQAALLLALLAKGFQPGATIAPLDISHLVPYIWAICDEEWAISIVKARMPLVRDTLLDRRVVYFEGQTIDREPYDTGTFPTRAVVYFYGQATDREPYDIEDLLIQILCARGRAWFREGRCGQVREGDTPFVPPRTAEARAMSVRGLLGSGPRTWYRWNGDETTRGMCGHELCYIWGIYDVWDAVPWTPRWYFFPDPNGNPYLVLNSRELLIQYMAWAESGPLEEKDETKE